LTIQAKIKSGKGKLETSLTPVSLRRAIIEQSKRAGVGHIGSALSIVDILAALFGEVLDTEHDVFILSKGHAALAYYCVLEQIGLIDKRTLDTYCGNNTYLGVHPEHQLQGVTFSTGSLGTGPSLGNGVALAKKINDRQGRVFVLLSDAELNEGSVWEALMFAGHHHLVNVCFVLDNNRQQALSPTDDVLNQAQFPNAIENLGWAVRTVDGHDVAELTDALSKAAEAAPIFVVANTVCGKGVSFMERKVQWHYLPLDDQQYEEALAEQR
jgi:transketolase